MQDGRLEVLSRWPIPIYLISYSPKGSALASPPPFYNPILSLPFTPAPPLPEGCCHGAVRLPRPAAWPMEPGGPGSGTRRETSPLFP